MMFKIKSIQETCLGEIDSNRWTIKNVFKKEWMFDDKNKARNERV